MCRMLLPMLYISSSSSEMNDTLVGFRKPEEQESAKEARWDFKKKFQII